MQANTKSTAMRAAGLYFGMFLILMISKLSLAAEGRPLPANAILGIFSPSALPRIVIDGQGYLLSAGAQIRNQNNLIVQTSNISGPDIEVLYKKSRQGQIDRIWILTRAEFDRIRSGVKPASVMPVIK